MFTKPRGRPYDCAICMYHDQALIPLKTIAFDDAVNVHPGIAVRRPPDHAGVDIAGSGKASRRALMAGCGLPRAWRGAKPLNERDRRTCRPLREVIREHAFVGTRNRSVRIFCSIST